MQTRSITSQRFFWNKALRIVLIVGMLLAVTPILAASADSTNYFSPTQAISHGPGWSNSIYALASDNLYATATKNNKQLKLTSFYLPAIPGGAIIDGIEVTVEGLTAGKQVEVAVSAGANFSLPKTTAFTSTESTLILGGPTDTWGESWVATDFQNKFTVKLTVVGTGGLVSIDRVQVKVYFTPPETTLILAPVSGTYGGTASMTATLTVTATHLPLAGRTINFSLNGVSVGSAVTDVNGVATVPSASLTGIVAGDYPYGAAADFAGDPPWDPTSTTADLRVYGLGTTLTVNPASGVYRGATGTVTAILTETVSGLPISGKTINFTLDDFAVGSAATDSSGIASISGIDLTGYDAGTYVGALEATFAGELNVEPAVGNGTLTVFPLELTVTGGLIPDNKTYDGGTTATLTVGSPTLNGVVNPDNVTLNTAGVTAAFSDKNVGNGKTVQISGLTLDGTEAVNYTVIQPTRQADITKASLTVKADNQLIILGHSDPSFTFQYTGFVGGDTSAEIDTPPACVPDTHTNIGNYAIVCSGGLDNNYDFTYINGTLSVELADIDVYVGGDLMGNYALASGEEKREYYPVSGGPVKVESTNAMIVSAIRLQSYANNTLYSFVETMGVPSGLLSHKYYFPTYNNTWAPLNSQIRFGNLASTTTRIRVTIGGNIVWEEDVPGLEERRLYFPVSGGPVVIESLDPTKKIVAAIRLQSYANDTLYSFAETMGIPAAYLSDTYYFPTYNNTWAPLNSQLRFGVP